MSVMEEYAQVYNVTYMSPFEGELLFAYLNYTSTAGTLSDEQTIQLVNQAQVRIFKGT